MRFLGKKKKWWTVFHGLVYHPKVLKVTRGCRKWIQGLKFEGFTDSYRGPFIIFYQPNQPNQMVIDRGILIRPHQVWIRISESFWFEPFVLKFTGCQAKQKHVTKTMGPLFGPWCFCFFGFKWLLQPPFWRDVLASGVGKFLTSYI